MIMHMNDVRTEAFDDHQAQQVRGNGNAKIDVRNPQGPHGSDVHPIGRNSILDGPHQLNQSFRAWRVRRNVQNTILAIR